MNRRLAASGESTWLPFSFLDKSTLFLDFGPKVNGAFYKAPKEIAVVWLLDHHYAFPQSFLRIPYASAGPESPAAPNKRRKLLSQVCYLGQLVTKFRRFLGR